MIITKKSFIQQFPLNQDVGQTYLSWTVGLLSVVMVFILTGFFSFYDPYTDLNSEPSFTIEIPFLSENPDHSSVLVERVLVFLKTVPALKKIEVVEKDDLLKLLEPWVNNQSNLADLNLPVFIDITVDNSIPLDTKLLTHQLRQIAAGIHVEPYGRWKSMVKIHHRTFQVLALGCVGLILSIMMILVSLVTKTSLMAYRSIVDILRLMGAKNAFIARQFQTQAFTSCLKGGFAGLIFGLIMVYGLSILPQIIGLPVLFEPLLRFNLLPFFLFLPFVTAFVSALVSRMTVSRLLYSLER